MQFKIITNEILQSCLSNLLMNNYKKTYEQFNKFINLKITEKQFEKFKKRGATIKEINEIIAKTNVNEKKEVERVKNIWNKKEDKIITTINELTNLTIDTKEITCYVDPYQKGGYYGEDNITIGAYENPEDILFVVAHELFHVFYWRKLTELKITKSSMGNEKPYEWELAEVTIHLLQTEPKMIEYWKTIEIEIYPEIKKLHNEVKKLWEENSFDNYLVKAYKLLENGKK